MSNPILRPPKMQDVGAVTSIYSSVLISLIGINLQSEQEMRGRWNMPGFNLETDARVATLPTGEIVGYAHVVDLAPHVDLRVSLMVYPEFQWVAGDLMGWINARIQQGITHTSPDLQVVAGTTLLTQDRFLADQFAAEGYEIVRISLDMKINLTSPPPLPQFPSHFTIRTLDPDSEARAAFNAVREVMRDHWGFVETPPEEAFQRYLHRLEAQDPRHDFFVALDGDQIAAFAFCQAAMPEDPNLAWIDNLGVRRPWRRQGLALAMLYHVFGEFYRRGKTAVGLGVDAENLTGATRLYEKAGMHVYLQFDEWEKVIRPGTDLKVHHL